MSHLQLQLISACGHEKKHAYWKLYDESSADVGILFPLCKNIADDFYEPTTAEGFGYKLRFWFDKPAPGEWRLNIVGPSFAQIRAGNVDTSDSDDDFRMVSRTTSCASGGWCVE